MHRDIRYHTLPYGSMEVNYIVYEGHVEKYPLKVQRVNHTMQKNTLRLWYGILT